MTIAENWQNVYSQQQMSTKISASRRTAFRRSSVSGSVSCIRTAARKSCGVWSSSFHPSLSRTSSSHVRTWDPSACGSKRQKRRVRRFPSQSTHPNFQLIERHFSAGVLRWTDLVGSKCVLHARAEPWDAHSNGRNLGGLFATNTEEREPHKVVHG
jgi:hypothetical protein